MERLCTEYETAMRFNFLGTEYVKGLKNYGYMTMHDKYDIASTMHYDSDTASNPQRHCSGDNSTGCVLEFYKDPDDHSIGTTAIMDYRENLSQQDIEWVRLTYPW